MVSPEWILEMNPDVIIGKVLSHDLMGYSADKSKALEGLKQLREKLMNDPAFKDTDAVKNNRVFFISEDNWNGFSYVTGLAYVAKYLHPEIFKDIDPESICREWCERWSGLPYRGIYAYPPLE